MELKINGGSQLKDSSMHLKEDGELREFLRLESEVRGSSKKEGNRRWRTGNDTEPSVLLADSYHYSSPQRKPQTKLHKDPESNRHESFHAQPKEDSKKTRKIPVKVTGNSHFHLQSVDYGLNRAKLLKGSKEKDEQQALVNDSVSKRNATSTYSMKKTAISTCEDPPKETEKQPSKGKNEQISNKRLHTSSSLSNVKLSIPTSSRSITASSPGDSDEAFKIVGKIKSYYQNQLLKVAEVKEDKQSVHRG